MDATTHFDPNCFCCHKGVPIGIKEKSCPQCQRVLEGPGWNGIDSHWRSDHADISTYEVWRESICKHHWPNKPPYK